MTAHRAGLLVVFSLFSIYITGKLAAAAAAVAAAYKKATTNFLERSLLATVLILRSAVLP